MIDFIPTAATIQETYQTALQQGIAIGRRESAVRIAELETALGLNLLSW